jgi:hypothetical protein
MTTLSDFAKDDELFKTVESNVLQKLSHLFLAIVKGRQENSNTTDGELLEEVLVLDQQQDGTGVTADRQSFDDGEFEVIESIKG